MKMDDTAYTKVFRQVVPGSGPRNYTRARNLAYLKYKLGPPVKAQEDVVVNTPSSVSVNENLVKGGGSGSGEVTATPFVHDFEYLCPVTIGGQTLNLNFDTGSSDLYVLKPSSPIYGVLQDSLTGLVNRWVFHAGLPPADTTGRLVYNPSTSKSFKDISQASFAVNYGDGSQTYGGVGVDMVTVGGITVMGQAVEIPVAVSNSFTSDTNSDGILGLAFQSINSIKPQSQPTFLKNAESLLQEPVFTANLKANTPGNYEFGVIDHNAYSGDTINYTPVDSSHGLWQFATKQGSSPGIADTGSSLLLLDDDIVNAYWAQVSNKSSDDQGILFPCDTTLPDFQIELGEGYNATIAGSLINYAPATDKSGCEYLFLDPYGSLIVRATTNSFFRNRLLRRYPVEQRSEYQHLWRYHVSVSIRGL